MEAPVGSVEPTDPPPEPEPELSTWPEAVVPLELLPAATRVTVHGLERFEVDNADYVAGWPAAAVERARTEADPSYPTWPHLSVDLEDSDRSRGDYPDLLTALGVARRIERSSTGAGSGAGAYDLRVASRVTYGLFEEVLLTSGQAGYGIPRILLGPDEELVTFEWPRARPSVEAPSEDALRAAVDALARGEEPDLPSSAEPWTRVTLGDRGVDLGLSCTSETDPATVAGCVRDRDVLLSVSRDARMGAVLPWVQQLSHTSASMRVVAR